MHELGAAAAKQYEGDGLRVSTTPDGARLRCDFQRLEGGATTEGLWLTSTVVDQPDSRFRVVARAVGRRVVAPLSIAGAVAVEGEVVKFIRPGVTEEYSISIDGVRQDFMVVERPPGDGRLRVELEVNGATVTPCRDGVRLTLADSSRHLSYNRLHVTDATGRPLSARMETSGDSIPTPTLTIVVDDENAEYPIRVDPTFSDENWISTGGFPGVERLPDQNLQMNGDVRTMAIDGAGHLYVGGNFKIADDILAGGIAKWDGAKWSALGSGVNGVVTAIAISGTNVYVGGNFTTAGGIPANCVAKWNGTAWSALGSGIPPVTDTPPYSTRDTPAVMAMAFSSGILYVGGRFTSAGGVTANAVARWNGNNWSAMGGGMGPSTGPYSPAVLALAVSGTTVYAGGIFLKTAGAPANGVARWNGSSWSGLGSGSGIDFGYVRAMAVIGSSLYVGGMFNNIGSLDFDHIARWNGSSWSWPPAHGFSEGYVVRSMAVSGTTLYVGAHRDSDTTALVRSWNASAWTQLPTGVSRGRIGSRVKVDALAATANSVYAGGDFTLAGLDDLGYSGTQVKNIAHWNGTKWSAMGGSGPDGPVHAVTSSGDALYIGGTFSRIGNTPARLVAQWTGSGWSAVGDIPPDAAGGVTAMLISGSDLYCAGRFSWWAGNTLI